MKRIAVIEDGYVRDTQVFAANPNIIEVEPDWEDHYKDVGCNCLYLGIFEGVDEQDIKRMAAEYEGVHPDIISLIAFD